MNCTSHEIVRTTLEDANKTLASLVKLSWRLTLIAALKKPFFKTEDGAVDRTLAMYDRKIRGA